MSNEKWGVAKVDGAEPERFFIFKVDMETPKARFMESSEFLLEAELKTDLISKGCAEAEINSLIERARGNPV